MKKVAFLFIFISMLISGLPSEVSAQDLPEKAASKTKNKANRRVDQKVDKSIDKGLDKIEGLFKKKKKKDKDKDKDKEGEMSNTESGVDPDGGDAPGFKGDMTEKEEIELWSVRYDFKPGKDIIFYDGLEEEEVGEIPSKWKYIKGEVETVEASNAGKVMRWTEKTAPNFEDGFVLPEKWTLEFDLFLKGPPYNASYIYTLQLLAPNSQHSNYNVNIGMGDIKVGSIAAGSIPDSKKEDFYDSWHHISMSFNKGSYKAYFDQYRLVNMRLEKEIGGVLFRNCCSTRSSETVFLVDNVKIAEGSHPKYKEEIINGKIVLHNINFEVNSSDLLSRSYAEIRRLADFMGENPELTFRVEGHTDSDGEVDYNEKLSEDRANSVKQALVDMGVDAERLSSKGWGESQPMAENNSPETKAMNRRVEFVKTSE